MERLLFANGELNAAAIEAIFSAFEVDMTFVDAGGFVRYFSPYRIFSRPKSCLDRHVLDCHSAASRPGIERMLSEFASGWRDEVEFVAHQDGRVVDGRYVALRDEEGQYLGCLELARWAEADATA